MEILAIITIALLLAFSVLTAILSIRYNKAKAAIASLEGEKLYLQKLTEEGSRELSGLSDSLQALKTKYLPVIDLDNELEKRNAEMNHLKEQAQSLNQQYQEALQTHKELLRVNNLYKDNLEIQEYGLYEPKYSFDVPDQYKEELEAVYRKQKDAIYKEEAALCSTEWTVGGSKVEGRKMTRHYTRLMLYAFNGECDSLIAKVRWNNVARSKERVLKAFESINKLGASHQIQITQLYLDLKLGELALTYEYEQKKQEEKEEQRRIREQMREEEKAQKEFEKAQREAEDEERKYQKALDKARQELSNTNGHDITLLSLKVQQLEESLRQAHERKERALSMAQMTKVGHIYVISNIGSFGEDVYKIGMTRRLDPLDRVKELGDASVPFQFDVHAIIYSENAPQLEYDLHKQFSNRRLNRINGKKEFFKVSLDEIESFITQFSNAEIHFTKVAEAKEYRETIAMLDKPATVVQVETEFKKYPESLFG